MSERENLYPGYDVLSKRDTPSWNEQTRRVVEKRLSIRDDQHEFLDDGEFATLKAVCDHILPRPSGRVHNVPVAALVDQRLAKNKRDGYRDYRLPDEREAWKLFLRNMDLEARDRGAENFVGLDKGRQLELLKQAEEGLSGEAWRDMPSPLFFSKRLLPDTMHAYYGHPTAWSEIGFGGPASPRGYVRMSADMHDPWEAAEARTDDPAERRRVEEENRRVGRT